MTHVLTMSADPLPEGAEQAAADILGTIGLNVVEANVLSKGRAVDLITQGTSEMALPDLLEALRHALPEIDMALQPTEGRRKAVLCADMDSTMVIGETIDDLADALGIKARVADITARAMRGELDFEEALDARVAMLRGLEAAAIDRVSDGLNYTPGALELVQTMRAHGAQCVLVSGGFDRVTGVVRQKLGFHRDIANHLEIGPDDRLTGKARRPIVDSGTKLRVLKEAAAEAGVALNACLAIGDGANDRAMVKAAGMGIAWQAKPTLKQATSFHIDYSDLRTALYFQGYDDDRIISTPRAFREEWKKFNNRKAL